MNKAISIQKFILSIKSLPPDEPQSRPGIWYTTQKEHWLGWLKEYNGSGAYNRIPGMKRDARYAYNHIVCHDMLLWLIEASGIDPKLANAARRATKNVPTQAGKSAAIRRLVPWDTVTETLWCNAKKE